MVASQPKVFVDNYIVEVVFSLLYRGPLVGSLGLVGGVSCGSCPPAGPTSREGNIMIENTRTAWYARFGSWLLAKVIWAATEGTRGVIFICCALPVLYFAGRSAYLQGYEVAIWAGKLAEEARYIPLVADACMVIASLKLRTQGVGGTARRTCRIVMWGALAISGWTCVQSAMIHADGRTGYELGSAIGISLIPLLGVFAVSEMLIHTHKGATPGKRTSKAKADKPVDTVPVPTVRALQAKARALGLTGYSKMTKKQLMALIPAA